MHLPPIPPIDLDLQARAAARVASLAKPPGALGRIEKLAAQIAAIRDSLTPDVARAVALVFAGDHGLTEDGVSRYPSAVTKAMAETMLRGKASVNAFAATMGAEVRVIDAGIAQPITATSQTFVDANIRRGTANAARMAAMSSSEADAAVVRGIALARDAVAEGFGIIAPGEMGIGNSASAALLMHRLADIPLADCVGRGAGQDDAGLVHKLAVLEKAAGRTNTTAPIEVVAQFGGCEIAMMAGAMIGAASARAVVMVDGFIATAAALVAVRLAPDVRPYMIFAHRSAEAGHARMLDALGAEPLLDLGMRLGEGTGAILAVPLVQSAARLLTDVATLDEVLATMG